MINEEKKEIRQIRNKRFKRDHELKKRYGITISDYEKMFDSQNGKCAICGISRINFGKSLCVDHDHKTGRVRGLVCNPCNTILGNAKDNVEILKSAIAYLTHTSACVSEV